jgi:hypothetical protein
VSGAYKKMVYSMIKKRPHMLNDTARLKMEKMGPRMATKGFH